MTSIYKAHSEYLAKQFSRLPPNLTNKQLLAFYEGALLKVWKKSRSSMSTVTLIAVRDRVVFLCQENFPLLNFLKDHEDGFDFSELQKESDHFVKQSIQEAFRCVFTEFVSILGSITNEVMTPVLYAELEKVASEWSAAKEKPVSGDEA